MQEINNRTRVFKSDKTREWATDFLIGIGMFVLVAFFASAHTDPALPASLEKTKTVLEQNRKATSEAGRLTRDADYEVLYTGSITTDDQQSTRGTSAKLNNNNIAMVIMALVFSTLLTLTIQFWRNLRRAYASPRRKWGRS